jgi:hypothetical protein
MRTGSLALAATWEVIAAADLVAASASEWISSSLRFSVPHVPWS